MSIPRLLHFVWLGPNPLPPWATANLAAWQALNPTYQVNVHGKSEVAPELQALYGKLTKWPNKSDLVRWSLLRQYGGWYADVDVYPLRPLDDLVRAYGCDGSKVVMPQQHGHKSYPRLPHASYLLGSAPKLPIFAALFDYLNGHQPPQSYACWGPEACSWLAAQRQAVVLPWPFTCPTSIAQARQDYAHALAGDFHYLREMELGTGHQLPFVFHLWAEAKHDLVKLPETPKNLILMPGLNATNDDPERWPEGHPMRAAAAGLQAAGYAVTSIPKSQESVPRRTLLEAKALVCWGGRREPLRNVVELAESMSVPVWRLEHGFFDRRLNTQVDNQGYLHWASWAAQLRSLPPGEPCPCPARKDGPILLLGQIAGDTQMQDSEIDDAMQLAGAVKAAIPHSGQLHYDLVLRPHPLDRRKVDRAAQWPVRVDPHETLAEALQACRFVVAINSNALNDALLAGVPGLCLGPFLGAQAGVVRQTKLADLKANLQRMIDGWQPDPARVGSYLTALKLHQYSNAELSCAQFWQERL